MKLKSVWILLIMVSLGLTLNARPSISFLQDGNSIASTIVDVSSRTGTVDYRNGQKIHRSRIWMINFENRNWNFPNERRQLSNNSDTIFLNNGHILKVKIVDFSSRRRVFEFRDGGKVHDGQIKRIYFCCTKLPAAYRKSSPSTPVADNGKAPATFLRNGRFYNKHLSYLNHTKTGFVGGPQINTKAIWMINFSNKEWNYGHERKQLDRNQDTIFLKDGEILYDVVVDYSKTRKTFRFENTEPLHSSKIKRIYFCCEVLPQAYKNKTRRGGLKHLNRRRR